MKKFLAIIAIAGFVTACNDTNTNQTTTDTTGTSTTGSRVDSLRPTPDSGATKGTLDTATTRPGVTADTSKLAK